MLHGHDGVPVALLVYHLQGLARISRAPFKPIPNQRYYQAVYQWREHSQGAHNSWTLVISSSAKPDI